MCDSVKNFFFLEYENSKIVKSSGGANCIKHKTAFLYSCTCYSTRLCKMVKSMHMQPCQSPPIYLSHEISYLLKVHITFFYEVKVALALD